MKRQVCEQCHGALCMSLGLAVTFVPYVASMLGGSFSSKDRKILARLWSSASSVLTSSGL